MIAKPSQPPKEPIPLVLVTIAHWNGRIMLSNCLASLRKQQGARVAIALVDNGSHDDSVSWIRTTYPEILLLPEQQNTGFGAAHNRAFAALRKQYPQAVWVLTLNNDVVLQPDFISQMVSCSERHPTAGSIQGKVLDANNQDIIDAAGIAIAYDMSAANHGRGKRTHEQSAFVSEEEIFGASASTALYRVAALDAVTLIPHTIFDADYFAYYEDVDLAWRLRMAGYSSWYTPRAVASHIHSATGINHSPFKAFHIHRNHYYNIIKNLPFFVMIATLLWMPIRYLLLLCSVITGKGASAGLQKKLVHPTIRTPFGNSLAGIVCHSLKDVLRTIPSLLYKRHHVQQKRIVSLRTVLSWYRRFHVSMRTIIFNS